MKRSMIGFFAVCVLGATVGCSVQPGDTGDVGSSSDALGTTGSGFAWVNPVAPTLDPNYAFDSAGGTVSYSRDATGAFTVRFPGLGAGAGDVQVSAYGATNVRCHTAYWTIESSSTLAIHVACNAPGGATADSPFSVVYNNISAATNTLGAYLLTSTNTGGIWTAYSWNHYGTSSVTHAALGVYSATLPGQTFSNASVHATLYGGAGGYCNVGGWWADSAAGHVNVNCFDASGNAADALFTLLYMPSAAIPFHVGGHGWISSPTSAPAGYARSGPELACSEEGAVSVSKPGNYQVSFTEVVSAQQSNALVTAYGATPNYCKVVDWQPGADTAHHETNVNVACFDRNGNPTTSQFDATYTSGWQVGPC